MRVLGGVLLLLSIAHAVHVVDDGYVHGEGTLTLNVPPQAEPHQLEGAMNVEVASNHGDETKNFKSIMHRVMGHSEPRMTETAESRQNGQSNEEYLEKRDKENDSRPGAEKHKTLSDIWKKELPCECPFNQWKPVCGIDGNTYPTECFAQCIGISVFVHSDCKYVRRELWARMQARLGNVATDYFEDGFEGRKTLDTHPHYSGIRQTPPPEPYAEEEEEQTGTGPSAPNLVSRRVVEEVEDEDQEAENESTQPFPVEIKEENEELNEEEEKETVKESTPVSEKVEKGDPLAGKSGTTTKPAAPPAVHNMHSPPSQSTVHTTLHSSSTVPPDRDTVTAEQKIREGLSATPNILNALGTPMRAVGDGLGKMADTLSGVDVIGKTATVSGLKMGVDQLRDTVGKVFPAFDENVQVSKLEQRLGRRLSPFPASAHHTHKFETQEMIQQSSHSTQHKSPTHPMSPKPKEEDPESHIEWRVFNGVKVPYDTREFPNPCPHCPISFNPVCGNDNKTYPTACFAICVGAEIANSGECESDSA